MAVKHNLSEHPLHTSWRRIKQRCYYKKNDNYKWYGGKGVKVCQEWLDDFKAFYDWSVGCGWRKGLEIDRMDSNGDYSPSNCRWVTHRENMRNIGSVKLSLPLADEIRIYYAENEPTITKLADHFSLGRSTVHRIVTHQTWVD